MCEAQGSSPSTEQRTKKPKPSCSEQQCKMSAQFKGALPTLFSNGLCPECSNLDTGWVRKLPGFIILRSIFSEGRFMNISKNNPKLQVILWEKSSLFFLNRSHAIPGWPQTCYLPKNGHEIFIIYYLYSFAFYFVLIACFGDRVSPSSPHRPGTHYAVQASHQLAEILLSLPLEYQFCRPGSHHLARSLYCIDASLSTVGAEEIPKASKKKNQDLGQ